MEMPDLLQRYFGTPDLAGIDPVALPAAIERMRVDFGLEKDRGKRFALWTLLYVLNAAPDLDVAFEDPADREAARNMMDMMASVDQTEDG